MNILWQHLLGAVQFSAEGGDAARLLSQCMEQRMALTQVVGSALGFTAWIPARQYKKLRRPARRCRVRVHLLRKRGLAFRFRRLRGRWGIVAGMVLFCMLVPWLQGCIWTVSYYDLSAQEALRLAGELQKNAITCGARPTSAELASARQKILLADDAYASLSFNFVKGRLIVEATRAEPKPAITDNATPADIIADRDGILYSMEVYSGYAVRGVGQSVHEGDMLVSHSYTDERTGATVTGRSRAKIIAQTETVFTSTQPFTFTRRLPTGDVLTQTTLCCGGWELPLGHQSLPEPVMVTTVTGPLAPAGWALPFSLRRTTQTALTDMQIRLTAQQAAARARLACDEAIASGLGSAEILSRDYEETILDETAVCTVRVVARQEIGKTIESAANVALPPTEQSSS